MDSHVAVVEELTPAQWREIHALWNSLYPVDIARPSAKALEKSIASHAHLKHYIVCGAAGEILGWCAVYDRYAVRWFSILVAKSAQGRSVGKALVDRARATEPHLTGWAISDESLKLTDGGVYRPVLDFYRKLDFEIIQRDEWPAQVGVTLPLALVTWSASSPVRPDFLRA